MRPGALASIVSDTALAQFYKGKTITMIVNYPAGGPTDIEGRIVAQHLPSAHSRQADDRRQERRRRRRRDRHQPARRSRAQRRNDRLLHAGSSIAQLVGNPALRTHYADFVMIAGVENPLVVYARKDTPPGLKVATDIMKTKDFKALSLNVQNSNTINQALALDLLGLKYQAVPAYRGLKEVETAILQNIGQLANSSLPGWRGSIETDAWATSSCRCGRSPRAPRTAAIRAARRCRICRRSRSSTPSVNDGKKPSGFMYEVLRASSDPLVAMFRIAMMPPKTNREAVTIMRAAFVDLWKDRRFHPRLFQRREDARRSWSPATTRRSIVAALGRVKPEIKAFLLDYSNKLVK